MGLWGSRDISRGDASTCGWRRLHQDDIEASVPSGLGWGLVSGSPGARGALWGPGVHRGRSGEQPCLGCTDHSLPGPRDCEPALSLPAFNHRCGCAGLGPLWAPRGLGRPAAAVLLAPGGARGHLLVSARGLGFGSMLSGN